MEKVLVVGGSGALGRAIVAAFAKSGAEVTLTSRKFDKAQGVAAEIGAEISELVGAEECDVTDPASVNTLAKRVNAWERLDSLVLCAGGNDPSATIAPTQTLADLDLAAARAVFDANCWSKLHLVKVLLPALQRSKHPSIVMIGSMAGVTPLTRVLPYSMAMASVHALVKALATEFGQKSLEYGDAMIRVNAVAPGFVPAEQNMRLLRTESGALTSRGEAILNHTPLGRFGSPAEIAPAVLFLCDPERSSFITGKILEVDGGFASMSI